MHWFTLSFDSDSCPTYLKTFLATLCICNQVKINLCYIVLFLRTRHDNWHIVSGSGVRTRFTPTMCFNIHFSEWLFGSFFGQWLLTWHMKNFCYDWMIDRSIQIFIVCNIFSVIFQVLSLLHNPSPSPTLKI